MQVLLIATLLPISSLFSLAHGEASDKESGFNTKVTAWVNMVHVGSPTGFDADKVLSSINSSHITHIIFHPRQYYENYRVDAHEASEFYLNAPRIAARGGTEDPNDEWIKLFHYKQKHRNVKVLLAIPSTLGLNPQKFVKVMLDGGFDGIDFGLLHGTKHTARKVVEIRNELDRAKDDYGGYHFLLTIDFTYASAEYYDYKTLVPIIDFWRLMDYVKHGPKVLVYNAPLFSDFPRTSDSVNNTVTSLIKQYRISEKKMVIGYTSRGFIYPKIPGVEELKAGDPYPFVGELKKMAVRDINPPRFRVSCSDRARACTAQDTISGDLVTLENNMTVTFKAHYARNFAGLCMKSLEDDYTGPNSLLSSASRGLQILDRSLNLVDYTRRLPKPINQPKRAIDSGSASGFKSADLASVAHRPTAQPPPIQSRLRGGYDAYTEQLAAKLYAESGIDFKKIMRDGSRGSRLSSEPASWRSDSSTVPDHSSASASDRPDKYDHFSKFPECAKNHPEWFLERYWIGPRSSDLNFPKDHPEWFSRRGHYLGPKPTDANFPEHGCAPNGTISSFKSNRTSHGVSSVEEVKSLSGSNSSTLSTDFFASAKEDEAKDDEKFFEDDDDKISSFLPIQSPKPNSDPRTNHSVGIGLSRHTFGVGHHGNTTLSAWSNSTSSSAFQATESPDSDRSKPSNVTAFRLTSLPVAAAVTSAPSPFYSTAESYKPNIGDSLRQTMMPSSSGRQSLSATSTDRMYPSDYTFNSQTDSRGGKPFNILAVEQKSLFFPIDNATAVPSSHSCDTVRPCRFAKMTGKLQPMSTPTLGTSIQTAHPISPEVFEQKAVDSYLNSLKCLVLGCFTVGFPCSFKLEHSGLPAAVSTPTPAQPDATPYSGLDCASGICSRTNSAPDSGSGSYSGPTVNSGSGFGPGHGSGIDFGSAPDSPSRLFSTHVTAEHELMFYGEQYSAKSRRKVDFASSAEQKLDGPVLAIATEISAQETAKFEGLVTQDRTGMLVMGAAAQHRASAAALAAMLFIFT